MINNR